MDENERKKTRLNEWPASGDLNINVWSDIIDSEGRRGNKHQKCEKPKRRNFGKRWEGEQKRQN